MAQAFGFYIRWAMQLMSLMVHYIDSYFPIDAGGIHDNTFQHIMNYEADI